MPNYQASKKPISNWGQIVLVLFAWDVLQKSRLNPTNVAEFYTWRTAPCVDKSLTWKKEDLRGRWIFASQPFYSLPPAPATFISFSSLWSWWLQSSGCCTCRSRRSSCRRTRSWWLPSASAQVVDRPNGRLPLKVAFYSTSARIIFQMSALTLAHISNVNIVLRTLATFYKDGLQIQNSK